MIRNDEQLSLAQEAVRNLQRVLTAARKIHTPAAYRAMSEPLLLELQQREQEILTYLSSTESELGCAFHTAQERRGRYRAVGKEGNARERLNAGQSHAIGEIGMTLDGGYPAMQMVLEIPEELKGVGEAVQALVRQGEASWRSTRGGRAVDYAAIERQVAAGAAAIERASHQAGLQGLDIDQPRVGMEGKVYRRVGR